MGSSANILFLSLAIVLPAIANSINYQPISITVNENFNAQPSETQQGMSSFTPNFVHQGANFYFYPQVKLPPRLIPPHISALLTSLHQKNESIMIQNEPAVFPGGEEIKEILKPIELSTTSNRGDIEEIALPIEEVSLEEDASIPLVPIYSPAQKEPETNVQAVVITETPMLPSVSVISEEINDIPSPPHHEHAIVEEIVGVPSGLVSPTLSINVNEMQVSKPMEIPAESSLLIPISANNEHDVVVQELSTLPEAPKLPLAIISDSDIIENLNESFVSSETQKEHETIIQDFDALPAAPVLPPLSINLYPTVIAEEINTLPIPMPIEAITEEIFETPTVPLPIYDKPEAIIQELIPIPDAPTLPPISVNFSSPMVTEQIHQEQNLETIILPADLSVSKPIEVIAEENVKIPPIPIPIHNKPETIIQELVKIPEAEDINEEPTLWSTVVPENSSVSKPVEVIAEEHFEIPSLPLHHITPEELTVIPEAPILPPPESLQYLPSDMKENEIVKPKPVEVPVKFPEPKPATTQDAEKVNGEKINEIPISEPMDLLGVFPTYKPSKIVVEENVDKSSLPIHFSCKINQINNPIRLPTTLPIQKPQEVVAEENVDRLELPIPMIYDKPTDVIQELIAVPEAPIFPALSIDGTPVFKDVILVFPNRPTQPTLQNFILEDILKRRPYSNNIAVIKKKINTAASKPSNIFPSFQIHKSKPMDINQKRLAPFPKLIMTMKKARTPNKNRFVFFTDSARNIVTDRIVPNMRMRGQSPKLFKIISSPTVPNFPV